MSEFIVAMGGSGNEYTVCEHTAARVLAGETEAVRARLVYALESLGYAVVSDNPLQARRARRKDIFRADFTDHPRRVAVGLRKAGAGATQATFDFVVTHGSCVATSGDLLTLEREADALAALAQATPANGLCHSCGTENGEGARFCRQCGAPNAAGAPAELEVLRLTAASRAGLQEIVCGVVIALLALSGGLALILLGRPKAVNIGWGVLIIGQLIGWWMALYGMLRIHRTLNRKEEPQAAPAPPQFAPAREATLPPAPFSVTEGTTELLGSAPRERERVRVRREQHSDTSPIG
jgi:hypothetical protein